jgi:hypothetical protein
VSTWFVRCDGRQLDCAEADAWLAYDREGKWVRKVPGAKGTQTMHPKEAAAMLAALGHRWDGAAIVPLPPSKPHPAVMPLDKPVVWPGSYVVRFRNKCSEVRYYGPPAVFALSDPAIVWAYGPLPDPATPAPEPTAPAMRCYAPDGTEYPAERWEKCHAKWQEGMWFVTTDTLYNNTLKCTVGVGGDHEKRESAKAPTIRAAFCAATTAYHRKANS